MQKLVADAGRTDISLDSAGTGDWHVGELADPRTREAADRRGYRMSHRSRQFVVADFDRFDLVVAMDRSNLANLERLARGRAQTPPIRLLRADNSDVPDPYAGGADGFEHVLDICEAACRDLLASV
jgi:protein-tyrosine phosphatase